MTTEPKTSAIAAEKIGLLAGPIIAIIVATTFRPTGLDQSGVYVAAVAIWMAIWWGTEAIHTAVTAFIPIIVFPILGLAKFGDVAASYSHPIIYLFLGGFIIAIAVQRSGLHKRVALAIFALSGVNARAIVAGFMIAAALLSMWISNTSTTMMMLPIAMSVVYIIRETMPELQGKQINNFELAMYLGLAYGSTMGGISTLVGTPPNAFMSGFMGSTYGIEVDFARWMIIGLPLTFVMLPLCWYLLVYLMFPVGFVATRHTSDNLAAQRRELGKITTPEIRTAAIFLILILGWLLRKPLIALTGASGITDATIAMAAAFATFLVPSGRGSERLMNWDDAKHLPWGVLLLFGGGLALAAAMTNSGLTEWIGAQLSPLAGVHILLLVLVACVLVIFLTELTSNLATTATFLPVMAALATHTGHDPLLLVIPITLAASFAFMLPVATPPNAIVFSTGKVSIKTMMRAGFMLNIFGVIAIALVTFLLVPLVFGK